MNMEARGILKNFTTDQDREIVVISLNCEIDEDNEWEGFVATIKKFMKQQNGSLREKMSSLFKNMENRF